LAKAGVGCGTRLLPLLLVLAACSTAPTATDSGGGADSGHSGDTGHDTGGDTGDDTGGDTA